ncbi:DUF1531-domain-containing protein [Mollisia scopiformis]|uniref:DUF1531-domain-containing protein n=1 Tax=Mollisia scopiformis TaxID=149040 RepID=A0A194WUY9_MOLSC|nr:DUF1531-domain-containing protein [Mollisia scopiformis]KUJ11417.1 DUF1531-domain-containing protein [Mollisia scopiformis]
MQANDIFEAIVAQLYHWGNNFHRNLFHMFDDMNTTRYLRLIACVGAYLLLRPYFVKIGEKIQAKEHEKQSAAKDAYEASTKGDKKKITPNALRGAGGKTVTFADSDEEDSAEPTGVQWGKKARQRQRKVVSKLLEKHEEKLREDDEEEDKDIMELLVDYEPGQDGW